VVGLHGKQSIRAVARDLRGTTRGAGPQGQYDDLALKDVSQPSSGADRFQGRALDPACTALGEHQHVSGHQITFCSS
jgi:hypothetical protein